MSHAINFVQTESGYVLGLELIAWAFGKLPGRLHRLRACGESERMQYYVSHHFVAESRDIDDAFHEITLKTKEEKFLIRILYRLRVS